MKAILNSQWGFVILVLVFALVIATLLVEFVISGSM